MSDAGDDEVHDAAVLVEEWHIWLQVEATTSDGAARTMRALVDGAVREMAEDLGHRLTALSPGGRAQVVVVT